MRVGLNLAKTSGRYGGLLSQALNGRLIDRQNVLPTPAQASKCDISCSQMRLKVRNECAAKRFPTATRPFEECRNSSYGFNYERLVRGNDSCAGGGFFGM
jgi:hypothetical protein